MDGTTISQNILRRGTNLIVAGGCLSAATLLMLPRSQGMSLTLENGPVENLSAVVLAVGAILAGLRLWRVRNGIWLAAFLMLLWAFLRELDYQKLFTPRSIESIGFYSRANVTLTMKLMALAALAPFAVAGLYLVVRGFKEQKCLGISALVWRRPLACAAGSLMVAFPAEKLFPPAGQIVEEIAELTFACLVVLLIAHFSRNDTSSIPVPRTQSALRPMPGCDGTVSFSRADGAAGARQSRNVGDNPEPVARASRE